MKTIEEKNRMIAEFMGRKVLRTIHELQYHTSWDWLMPVLNEIVKVCKSQSRWMLDRTNMCRVEVFKHVSIFSEKEKVFNAVIEFIEWYNENKEL